MEILFAQNSDLTNIVTPVDANMLETLLNQHGYDQSKTEKLVKGFRTGFELGYQGSHYIKKRAPNLKLSVGSVTELWNKVIKEVEKGCYAGPFREIPYEYYTQSPIGLVPKDQGKDTRLIFHLSYPRNGDSVNSQTPEHLCSMEYPDFDQAVQLCLKVIMESNTGIAFQGKSDMKSAFRNLPLSPLDFMLTLMKATNPLDSKTYYFVDKCLPFGASISCSLFQEFSNAVAFLFTKRTGKQMVNYLDDYYFVAMLKALCDGQIQEFLQICELIKFPVSMEKTFWGSTVIVFLGFLIDAVNRIASIPAEKVERAQILIDRMLGRESKKTTLQELQKLCGFLNHLCKAIVPGRAFTRRLYAYTAGSHLLPHHHISVNREMRLDLETWKKFLNTPNVYARPFVNFPEEWTAEKLFWYTDALKNPILGFGGIFEQNWFRKRWFEDDLQGNFIIDLDPSIEFLELFVVAVSVRLWIYKVRNRTITLFCDNESVVKMLRKSSSSCKKCMILIRKITLLCLEFNVSIWAEHVKTKLNPLADSLSHFQDACFYRKLKKLHRTVNKVPEQIPADWWPVHKVWQEI